MHQQWSGKALETRQQKPAFRYVYPKEGIICWMDNVAVPTGALHSGALKVLARAGVARLSAEELGRQLLLERSGVRVILVRPADVPAYVDHGAADFRRARILGRARLLVLGVLMSEAAPQAAAPSPWSPFRYSAYTVMWLAAVIANAAPASRVVVDMSGVEFCDSTGLNVLLRFRIAAESAGRALVLTGMRSAVARLFAITGADTVFTTFPSIGDALEGRS